MSEQNAGRPSVGVIGGKGQLGRWCAELFEAQGCLVRVSDIGTDLSNREVATTADIVFVSVPIGVTGEVLREVCDVVRSDQLIVDVTSVKTPFVDIMERSRAEALSLHPMFAPNLPSGTDLACLVCTVRRGSLSAFVEKVLVDAGIRLVPMTPEEHDRTMAVVQGMTHFQAIVAAHCMAEMSFNPSASLEMASPVYRMRLATIGRILAQSPRLYAEIQIHNPYVPPMLERLRASQERLMSFVLAKDVEGFVAEFEMARAALREFGELSVQEFFE